jgi:hypothetical protein
MIKIAGLIAFVVMCLMCAILFTLLLLFPPM